MAIPIICDGDSLTVGVGETNYPTQLAVLYPGATYAVVHFGNSGQTLVDMEADASTQIDSTYDPLHTRGVLVCWGGVNDFNNGATKEQVFANLTTYVAARLAAGWRVIVCTLTPAPEATMPEASRIWHNNQIRTTLASAYPIYIADLAADSRIGDAGDNLDTNYYKVDQLHMVTNGYAVVAGIVAASLPAALADTEGVMTYTEFCCKPTGSNLNAGTRNGSSTIPGDAADFTYASGNWVASTGVFTPASGNPLSDGVAVGDMASVYADGASVTGFIGRVTARNSTTITVSILAKGGSVPTDGTGNRTLKIGGAWAGPNGTSAFPFGVVERTLTDVSGNAPRVNFKNGTAYAVTAAMTHANNGPIMWQGYTTAYADGGKAIIDGTIVGASYVILTCSGTNNQLTDLIFANNGTTNAVDGLVISGAECLLRRVVVHDIRGNGYTIGSGVQSIGCEAYACNGSNTAATGGFFTITGCTGIYINCISHDNVGSNSHGFGSNASSSLGIYVGCIADSNGGHGWHFVHATGFSNSLTSCDAYNNTGDGVRLAATTSAVLTARNSNFLKNGGWGINITATSPVHVGGIINCGFGAGTQANTSGTIANGGALEESGNVTYAADVTPWVDPANGDFRINLAAAKGTGYGGYTQTQASYAGTVAYPDIGAGQHLDSGGVSLYNGGSGVLTAAAGPI